MKILEIISTLSSGGAERFVVDLSNQFAKNQEDEILLLTLIDDEILNNSFYKAEISSNIQYINLKQPKFTLNTIFRTFTVIKELKPDIVHVHLKKVPIVCILAIIFYRKARYIETIHNKAEEEFKNITIRLIKKFFYRFNLLRAVAISDENKRSFENVLKIKNTELIYNGTRALTKSNLFDATVAELNKYKLTEDTIVFTHIGRCSQQKNQELLIESFNKIVEKGYNAVLLIIGAGFDSTTGKKLRGIAKENIYFLNEKRNIQDYLILSDGFCLSSRYEGMPITLLEAFACGCATISTPVSGAVDIIKDGETGFISPDFTEKSYVQTLERFLRNKNQINKEHLKKVYYEKFSIEKCSSKYYSLFKKLSN